MEVTIQRVNGLSPIDMRDQARTEAAQAWALLNEMETALDLHDPNHPLLDRLAALRQEVGRGA